LRVKHWMTPTTTDSRGHGYQYAKGDHENPVLTLTGQARGWTVTADHENLLARGRLVASRRVHLNRGVKWATPRASDGDKSGPNTRDGSGSPHLTSLASRWATPTARDYKDSANLSEETPTNCLLGRQVQRMMPLGEPSSPGGPTSHPQLNVLFDEWLMGFPIGWTGSAPVGMEWCRWRRLTRSWCSQLVSASGLPWPDEFSEQVD
jgi:hypothetical protein